MVYIVFIVAFIFLLPLFFTVYFYLDVKGKKLYIAIYLYKYIKVLSSYITIRNPNGFYFHISNTKVIIIDKNLIKKLQNGPNILPMPTIFNVYTIIDSGMQSDTWLFFLLNFYYGFKIFNFLTTNNTSYLKLKTDLNLINSNENLIGLKCKLNFSFNLFGILYKIFVNLIVKGVNNAKKLSKQNYWYFKYKY